MTTPDVNLIIAFEQGEASLTETLDLFGDLTKTGVAWNLQGSYGRTADALIEDGVLTPEGDVTDYGQHLLDHQYDY